MEFRITPEEVDARLRAAGWTPGRDAGPEAAALADEIAAALTANGYEVTPFPAAVEFIREFAFLEVPHPDEPNAEKGISFTVRYFDEDSAESVSELSEWAEQPLFPVAFDRSEFALALIDPLGRFYLTHWSGDYYLGKNRYEAFACLFMGDHFDLTEMPSDS
ncbi:SUKH-3 domain-containing protein [Streptomyces sp. CA-181903]|uniref:SUKH-3 domain-containing protein n=1 Tax=Streptomyces sp. CA-181903 TaxID=3240055 RepID=UPI003D8E1896